LANAFAVSLPCIPKPNPRRPSGPKCQKRYSELDLESLGGVCQSGAVVCEQQAAVVSVWVSPQTPNTFCFDAQIANKVLFGQPPDLVWPEYPHHRVALAFLFDALPADFRTPQCVFYPVPQQHIGFLI